MTARRLPIQRLGTIAVFAVVLAVAMAGPALADPAGPTNYRSVVTSIDPRPSGVTIEVVGGDAFLSIAIAEGHTLEVLGYFGEPYLRIDDQGEVWLNTLSPARYINQDRYGLSGVPDFADAKAEPEWEQVASDGVFAWHDHRIHWMSYDLPPTVIGDRAQSVFPWTVTMFIDDVETKVSGELLWFPSVNPSGPLLIGLIGLLPFIRHRRRVVTVPVVAGAAVGSIALFVAVAQYGATPSFDRAWPIEPVFPAVAIAAAVGATWFRANPLRAWALAVVSGLGLVWWSVTTADAMTAPILASALPEWVERLTVGLALWSGLTIMTVSGYELLESVRGDTAPTDQPATA